MQKDQFSPRKIIVWALLIIGVLALLALTPRLTDVTDKLLGDYLEYWCAGRLNASGQNPYDKNLLSALRLTVNPASDFPMLMWNPPWVITLVMPFGLLDYPVSRILWYLIELIGLLISFNLLWDFYGGPAKYRWVAWIVGFTHWATLELLRAGQITPFVLIGVVGFLYFARRRSFFTAGMCLALLTIKPHVLYLFGLAVVLWVIQQRQWRVLYGSAAAITASLLVASLPNPGLAQQYIYAATHYPPAQWVTTTLGGVLRWWLAPDAIWLQFLPLLPGVIWFVFYWRQQTRRPTWDWVDLLPALTLASLITTAYGWRHDQVITLFALIPASVFIVKGYTRVSRWLTALLVLLYWVINWISITVSLPQHWFWWTPIWVAIWYIVVTRLYKPASPLQGS